MDDDTFAKVQQDPLINMMIRITSVPDIRSAVLMGHGFVELLVNAIIDAKCKNAKKITKGQQRDFPHSVKLMLLHELDLIPDDMYQRLEWFRKLRNRAAHEPFFQMTASDLDWVDPEVLKKPVPIGRLLFGIIGWFWNLHIDILRPIFAPALNASDDKPGG